MAGIKETQKVLKVRSHLEELAAVRRLNEAMLRESGVPDKVIPGLVLAVDEALGSMMAYNREKGFGHELTLTLDVSDVRYRANIVDPKTEWELNPSYGQLHGDRKYKISFYLICKVMDEVSYTYKRGFENQLELVKFL